MDNEKLGMEEGIATEKEKKLQFQEKEKENETQNISDLFLHFKKKKLTNISNSLKE